MPFCMSFDVMQSSFFEIQFLILDSLIKISAYMSLTKMKYALDAAFLSPFNISSECARILYAKLSVA